MNCGCIEAYQCARCGECLVHRHERGWIGLEKPVLRRFYVDSSSSFVNPGWNEALFEEWWFLYHPRNGCWKAIGHGPAGQAKGIF